MYFQSHTLAYAFVLSQKRPSRFILHMLRGKLKDYVMCNSREEGRKEDRKARKEGRRGGIQSKPGMDVEGL